MEIYVPGQNPEPSPSAMRDAILRREYLSRLKFERSYRGNLPIDCPSYEGWLKNLQAIRIGTPGAMTGGMSSISGVDTRLLGSNSWTPAIGSYVLFLDGDRGTFSDTAGTTPAVNNGALKRWNDQSGNSHNMSGDSGTNRTLLTSNLNGHNVVNWNGSAGGFRSIFTLNQACTIFIVAKTTWVSSSYFCDGGSLDAASFFCQSASVGAYRAFAGAGANFSVTTTDNVWEIMCLIWNGSSSQLRINAGTAVTFNPSTGNPGGFTLFSGGDTTQGPKTGSCAAVIVYPSALSTANETTERNDLNARFTIF